MSLPPRSHSSDRPNVEYMNSQCVSALCDGLAYIRQPSPARINASATMSYFQLLYLAQPNCPFPKVASYSRRETHVHLPLKWLRAQAGAPDYNSGDRRVRNRAAEPFVTRLEQILPLTERSLINLKSEG